MNRSVPDNVTSPGQSSFCGTNERFPRYVLRNNRFTARDRTRLFCCAKLSPAVDENSAAHIFSII
ncbi:hypothetical protein E2C01_062339 [Portunus trituberculatus]|uniref:Uncharacterized protein n=1 Tax=Portunus trituberculatus TaxID=210409 RepID=A0A5B7HAU7_PORTR|nr:hypothetical protein [Portunus trituberculatus]